MEYAAPKTFHRVSGYDYESETNLLKKKNESKQFEVNWNHERATPPTHPRI